MTRTTTHTTAWSRVAIFAVVVWIMAMVAANNTGGVRAELPIVGKFTAPYADRLADSVK